MRRRSNASRMARLWSMSGRAWPLPDSDQHACEPTRKRRLAMSAKACVIGSGPNGLAAAIVLAQGGWKVDVFEAEAHPGGAARTIELTVPGFLHDFGSAVHPLAVGSPFFSSLPLPTYGLEWIHSPSVLAHPLDDGTAVTLERDLSATCVGLEKDGKAWR